MLTLAQGAQNSSGDWPITGSETSSLCNNGQPMNDVFGTLDEYRDFTIYVPCMLNNNNCIEWLLLNSGDVTSQGLSGSSSSCDLSPLVPNANFLDGAMDEAEGPYYLLAVPPLFKSQTDLPASETPMPVSPGWQIYNNSGSTAATYSAWERTLVALPGGPPSFAGRFVYEQQGGTGTDGCHVTGSITAPTRMCRAAAGTSTKAANGASTSSGFGTRG